jgi:putative endonuclease
MRFSWVYMLASRRNGTLYVGVTMDLMRRVAEHREGRVAGFTSEHSVKRLVWFETYESVEAAIRREKRLKEWHRGWKVALIEKGNPEWRDLWPDVVGMDPAVKPRGDAAKADTWTNVRILGPPYAS